MSDSNADWYYQPSTGEVFQGKKAHWNDRMGPYTSEAEARAAMKLVAERNAAADQWDDDDQWDEED